MICQFHDNIKCHDLIKYHEFVQFMTFKCHDYQFLSMYQVIRVVDRHGASFDNLRRQECQAAPHCILSKRKIRPRWNQIFEQGQLDPSNFHLQYCASVMSLRIYLN